MEQRDNYVSRVRISSLTRTHNQNQSSNSPEEDPKQQSFINSGEQGQGRTQLQTSYLAPQNWAQGIHPFQSKFTSIRLTGAQLDDTSFINNPSTGLIGGNQTAPHSIASRFFGQNQQEFQQQSTQIPDDHEENIDEELVNFKSAIQQFNTISHKIQQQQNQQMNIIQRVMDDDLANQGQHLLNAPGFRQLNPFQVNNYLGNNIGQALNLPTMERQQTPQLDVTEEEPQVNAFARKSSVAATNPIMPMFMQKNHSSSKENSGESSLPAASQNPLIRLRQEIRNQQTNQSLYEQIQHLAEQLKLSQQMMSVEGNEINLYQEDKIQMLQQLQSQVDKNKNKLSQQQVATVEPNKSQSQSQQSTGNFAQHSRQEQSMKQQEFQSQQDKLHSTPQQREPAKTLSFIEQQKNAAIEDHQNSLRLLQQIQEAKQAMSNSVIAGLVEQANLSNVAMEQQSQYQDQDMNKPVQVQIMDDDDGIICISRNKNVIKKRSFVEVQKTNHHESQGSGQNDRCLSEQKSSNRYKKKWAKSEYLEQSNQRMREESVEKVEQSDHQSVGQKSGSSQLRSVKSLRKKNIQMEKSAFSAKRKFEEIIEDQSQDQSQQRNQGVPVQTFDLVTSQEQAQANQSSQLSALQKMIGPLTISERHQRILKFIHKKHNKSQAKKFTYECRKSVAEKRLRIKGRFVTKQQAFQILGLKENDIQSNEALQRLLEQHYNINNQTGTQLPFSNRMSQIMHFQLSKKQGTVLGAGPLQNQPISEDTLLQAKNGRSTIQVNSLIQNADGTSRTIKIRNFQALFDQAYSNQASLNDTTLNEAMMTGNEENSLETHNSFSLSKEQPEKQIGKLSTIQPPLSQAILNCSQMSLLGSKISMYNAANSASKEYYSQQMGVLEMQQQLRVQDEQNASATNSLLEGLVQPPMFKIERMVEKEDDGLPQPLNEVSEHEGSYPNKFENDSDGSLCHDKEMLEED